jgi:ornithine cyclodeaminase
MRVVGAAEIHATLDYPALIGALRDAFRVGCEAPLRQHYRIAVPGVADGTLLVMPAWRAGEAVGVKIVTVFPGNASRGQPALGGEYLLLDGLTGTARLLADGPALTARRTAAASALAAFYLAPPDATRLLMVGTGALAPHLIAAHAANRPIRHVSVWGRRRERAEAIARTLVLPGVVLDAVGDLATATSAADIVCCATLAEHPLIAGRWLRAGQHIDLVGGFTPEMREVDDEAVARARVYVDTREGALREAGDIVQPITRGLLRESDIAGDLFDLARLDRPVRGDAPITLFKSVGTALEDLAAATLLARRLNA